MLHPVGGAMGVTLSHADVRRGIHRTGTWFEIFIRNFNLRAEIA